MSSYYESEWIYEKKDTEIGPSSLVNKEGNEGIGASSLFIPTL